MTVGLDELRALARGVALDRRLEVVVGDPGGGWSLEPTSGTIRCDPVDLARAHPDDIRGLVCHEAAHAAVTRYPWFVPPDHWERPGLAVLLNALEDCRIEAWLARRLPGARPWIARYNDRLFPRGSRGLQGRPKLHQFALAAVHLWWHGDVPQGLDEDVLAALRATEEARAAVVDAAPPLAPPTGIDAVEAYARRPVARCFALADRRAPPDAYERAVRVAAWDAWERVQDDVLPALDGLWKADRDRGGRLAAEDEALLRRLSGRPSTGPLQPARRPSAVGAGEGGAATATRATSLPALDTERRRAMVRVVRATPAHAYERARREVRGLVRPLTDELLASLRLASTPRWVGGHPTGTRLDLMAAMQGEADPRRRALVWQRKTLPHRIEPSFLLLVDLSGSMEGRAITTALRGTVLLCEVLHLLRVPFAVAGFQDQLLWLKRFDESLSATSRARVSTMEAEVRGQQPGGNNRPEHNWDGPVLRRAAQELVAQEATRRFLVMVSDGRPSGPDDGETALRRAVAEVEADPAVRLLGLGLGPGTEHVARYYAHHAANVPLHAFPSTLGQILRSSLRGPP